MSESQLPSGPDSREQGQPPYVPASPVKRIIAWVAVVYMVLLILLNIYPFFRKGTNLYGVFPLMVCPGAAGLFVLCLLRLRQNLPGRKKAAMIALAAACVLLFVMGLHDGLPALLTGLRGTR